MESFRYCEDQRLGSLGQKRARSLKSLARLTLSFGAIPFKTLKTQESLEALKTADAK